MVKELREATGAGMMDAKKALTETAGDFESAIDWLRTKGLAKAAKKSGRIAAEGLIATFVNDNEGVVLEVNSETDFVGKNAEFQEMVETFAKAAIRVNNLDELSDSSINNKTVKDILASKIATIGENLTVRRMKKVFGKFVSSYVHNSPAPGLGKIGVLVVLDKKDIEFGHQLAMHIAATSPKSLDEKSLEPAVLERERNIFIQQARESGKPEEVIEKMIIGRIKKFISEVTLLGQNFVINPDLTVEQAAATQGVNILDYVRFEVGEGIEKKEEDFAAEVAKAAQA